MAVLTPLVANGTIFSSGELRRFAYTSSWAEGAAPTDPQMTSDVTDDGVGTGPNSGDTAIGLATGANLGRIPQWSLTNVDANFGDMVSLSIGYSTAEIGPYGDDDGDIEVIIVTADELTVLAGASSTLADRQIIEEHVGGAWSTIGGAAGPAYNKSVAFTYVNTGASKAQWDGAICEIKFTDGRQMGSDSASVFLVDFELTGTYNTSGPTSHPITASGAVTSSGDAAIGLVQVHPVTASGAVTSGGSAAIDITVAPVEHPITASGAVVSAGVAALDAANYGWPAVGTVQERYEVTVTSVTVKRTDPILRPARGGATGDLWVSNLGLPIYNVGKTLDTDPIVANDFEWITYGDSTQGQKFSVPLQGLPSTFVSANTAANKIGLTFRWAITGYTTGTFRLRARIVDEAGVAVTDDYTSASANQAATQTTTTLSLNAHGLTVNTAGDWATHRLEIEADQSDGTAELFFYSAMVDLLDSTMNGTGNVLVGAISVDKNSGAITDPTGTGWNLIQKANNTSHSIGMWWRVVTGDVNDVFDPSWVTAFQVDAHLVEFEDPGGNVSVDASNLAYSTETATTGVTLDLGTATADGHLVGFAGIDSDPSVEPFSYDTLTALYNQIHDHDSGTGQSVGSFGVRGVNNGDARSVTSNFINVDQNSMVLAQLVSAGPTPHPITASGATVSAGSATLDRTATLVGAGDVVSSGAVSIAQTLAGLSAVGAVTTAGAVALEAAKDLAASGAVTTAGVAAVTTEVVMGASGSISTSGVADIDAERPISGAGAVVSSGLAAIGVVRPMAATGATVTGGDAAIERVVLHPVSADGATVTAGAASFDVLIGVGATGLVTTAGVATFEQVHAVDAAGLIVTDGVAAIDVTTTITASGAVTTSGAAPIDVTTELSADGATVTAGAAAIELVIGGGNSHTLASTGFVSTTGAVSFDLERPISASGLMTSDGAATMTMSAVMAADGAIVTSGAVSVDVTAVLSGDGATVTGGEVRFSDVLTLSTSGAVVTSGSAAMSSQSPSGVAYSIEQVVRDGLEQIFPRDTFGPYFLETLVSKWRQTDDVPFRRDRWWERGYF